MKEHKLGEDTVKVPMYTIAKSGEQADSYSKTTEAIGEYVGKVYGHEMKMLVIQLQETNIIEPDDLSEKPSRIEEMKWGKQYDLYLKKKDKYEEQKAKVFSIVVGQCETSMKNRIESQAGYATAEKDRDVIALLKMIKDIAFDANDKKYPPMQAALAWGQLTKMKQKEDEGLTAYYKRFESVVERIERAYGEISPVAVAEKDPKYNQGKAKAISRERDRMLAYMFMQSGHKGFTPLLRDMENDYALGHGKFPETVEEALQVLTMYMEQPLYKIIMKKQKKEKQDGEATPEMSFAQMSKKEKMKKGLCFKCGKKGHLAANCKEDEEEEEQQHFQQLQDESNTGSRTLPLWMA